jgi:hypothetical protein
VDSLFASILAPIDQAAGDPKGPTIRDRNGSLGHAVLAWRAEEKERRRLEEEANAKRQREAAEREAAALAKALEATTPQEHQLHIQAAAQASGELTAAVLEAPRPMHKTTKTEDGSVTERTRLVVTAISDYSKLPPQVFAMEPVVRALTAAVQKLVDAGLRDLPGVVLEEQEGLTKRTPR